MDAPLGKLTLYSEIFGHGSFRLPITTFGHDILLQYSLHITQVHPLGMMRLRHFVFCIRCQCTTPSVDKFFVCL